MKKLPSSIRILLLFCFTVCVLPDLFRMNPVINYISLAVRGVAGFISVLILFNTKKKNKSVLYLCAFVLYVGLITAIKTPSYASITRYLAKYIDIIIIAVLTDFLLRKDTARFIRYLNTLVWVGLIANCASVVFFPDGLVKVANEVGVFAPAYLYDYDNHFIVRYIPTVAVIYIHEKYQRGKPNGGAKTIVSLLLCLFSLIYLHSIASYLAIAFMLLAITIKKVIPDRIVSSKIVWFGYLGGSTIVTLGALTLYGTKLAAIFGKNTSLLVRLRMWSIAVSEIPKNIVFGTGVLDSTIMRKQFGYAQLHNSMLTILLWGGIIGLILYSIYICSLVDRHGNIQQAEDKKFFIILLIGTMIVALLDGIELLPTIYVFYTIISNNGAVANLSIIPTKRKKIKIKWK